MMSHFISEEDREDFEQEKRIREWLLRESHKDRAIVLPYTSSKGTARHSRVKAAFSLDQKVSPNSETTFANFIIGSDGRDLYDGELFVRNLKRELMVVLYHLGIRNGLAKWTIKNVLKSANQNKLLCDPSPITSDW